MKLTLLLMQLALCAILIKGVPNSEFQRCRALNCDDKEAACAQDNKDCLHAYIEQENCFNTRTDCASL